MTEEQLNSYRTAYNYLRKRTRYLRYADFKTMGYPIGSGVTEAGCKTVFTQRFKQSGMSWSIKGGSAILSLRVATQSRTWNATWDHYLQSKSDDPNLKQGGQATLKPR